MNHYKEFVLNIQIFNAEYNRDFSSYRTLLPTPIKCPFKDSCNGGIESSCTEGYEGTLCATCSSNHFLRFNRCLECPSMLVTVISCVLVIVAFIVLFLLIFWGDSNAANGERGGTAADVVMSCVKIVVGFYQVASGIFSALRQVQWPVVLVSMEKYLKFVEGNILQFAPLSCIDPVFRLDPFMQFCLSISIHISVVLLILIYLLLRRHCIKKLEISDRRKKDKISHLKKVMLPKRIPISSVVLPNNEQENYQCHSAPARSLWGCVFHQRWQWLHFSPESWLFHFLPQSSKWCVLETSSRMRNISSPLSSTASYSSLQVPWASSRWWNLFWFQSFPRKL